MDRIKFVVEDYVDKEGGWSFPTINIYINNRNLIDLVSEVELGRRKHEAGYARSAYIGFHAEEYDLFRSEALALHRNPYSVLLTCTCTIPECSCIIGEVSLQSEMVFWSEIRNPFLASKDPYVRWDVEDADAPKWKPLDYSCLGVFVFRREEYVHAVNDLGRYWRIWRRSR